MIFEAAWQIPSRFFIPGRTAKACREDVERSLHSACGPMMATNPEFPRTGRDWCWTNSTAAKEVISEFFGVAPNIVAGHVGKKVTNDNFRNPHPLKVAENRFKVVVWIYRELHTGRLKTQYVDDWTSPRERARRYSRNGIEEMAAFTYRGQVSPIGNAGVLDAWAKTVSRFGSGPDDIHYGWLREQVELSAVEEFLCGHLEAVSIGPDVPPEGVRGAYNKFQ